MYLRFLVHSYLPSPFDYFDEMNIAYVLYCILKDKYWHPDSIELTDNKFSSCEKSSVPIENVGEYNNILIIFE